MAPHSNQGVLWGVESQTVDSPQAACICLKCMFDFAPSGDRSQTAQMGTVSLLPTIEQALLTHWPLPALGSFGLALLILHSFPLPFFPTFHSFLLSLFSSLSPLSFSLPLLFSQVSLNLLCGQGQAYTLNPLGPSSQVLGFQSTPQYLVS